MGFSPGILMTLQYKMKAVIAVMCLAAAMSGANTLDRHEGELSEQQLETPDSPEWHIPVQDQDDKPDMETDLETEMEPEMETDLETEMEPEMETDLEQPAIESMNCNTYGCCSCSRVGGFFRGKCRPKGPGCNRYAYCQCRSKLRWCYGTCVPYGKYGL